MFVNISMIDPKGEERTSINDKMLNSCSSFGWSVLNFPEELKTSGTFFASGNVGGGGGWLSISD